MSKRFYITLNSQKDKDKIILDYLSSTYNESETIKSLLYKVATDGGNTMQLDDRISDSITIREEQSVANSTEKVTKDEELNNNKIVIDEDIMGLFK
ncbi:hypothetical protein LPC13_13320 [Clostridium celatum]|uniref:hypothetical protein n=1 Tax=Clostridium celatum TaxID=36834 RepID=UPI001F2815B6|nr:hypothetical protein [Clostridium celatum]MCE9656249.1 hypothetical protein [Clostridium celatum]